MNLRITLGFLVVALVMGVLVLGLDKFNIGPTVTANANATATTTANQQPQVFQFDDQKVNAFELHQADKSVRVEKQPDGWFVAGTTDPANRSSFTSLIVRMSQLKATRAVDNPGTDLSQYGLEPPKESRGGGSDDIGDISWNVHTVYMFYPANIPNLPGHSWPNAVAMATPIAHKGSSAGAKVQATTALDFLLRPELVTQAWDYFRDVQTKDVKYVPLMEASDKPAVELNKDKMEKFAPQLKP